MAGAERVFWLIDYPVDWEDDRRRGRPAGSPERRARRPAAGRPGPVSSSAGSRSATSPDRPVLHDIDFAVAEPGQSVALVGHTGSGKSSIINLAAKFYLPTPGRGPHRRPGHPAGHRATRSTGRWAWWQQQNFLFSGTVLDNIRLSRPEASEEEVREAARRLDCIDILDSLPRGLRTEVGERGAGSRSGQRQLVCFCRAWLADPRIVILDEATSSIDAVTEHRLQKALVTLLDGRTSFIVAHRLSTIRHADLVLVLDQGRIVERGTHGGLLAAGGHYAALYRQFVQVDDSS